MPPPIVASEGVKFVNHHSTYVCKERCVVNPIGYHNRFERFGRRQQNVWRIANYAAAHGIRHIAVPQRRATAQHAGVAAQPRLKVVQQSAQRADVKH